MQLTNKLFPTVDNATVFIVRFQYTESVPHEMSAVYHKPIFFQETAAAGLAFVDGRSRLKTNVCILHMET